jgi:hypothetical protein
MTGNFEARRTLCLLNENVQCNPIWISRQDGLQLAHFQTLHRELTREESAPGDASYEKCARHCLAGTDHF